SLDNAGRLTGTPNVTFEENEDHKVVTLKATVSKANRESKQVDVPITVYKPLDATKVAKEGTNGLPLASTNVLTPNQNDVTILPATANGLTVDEHGNVSGTPKVEFPSGQDSVTVEIPVTLRKADRLEKTVRVIVTVNKNDAEKTTPTASTVTKPEGELTAEDVTGAVDNKGTGTVTLKPDTALPTQPGNHKVPVVVTYPDNSTDELEVPVTIT
ncbi:hypothetical protein JDW15_10515, partial [Aerococcaceae bacterium zg-ZJ1578]|uniref:Rib/alpha-like domain-containing protein n=1 Tax=Aerococcaceae bacterium zg-252 TaxID=2796928 RepID=UPI001A2D61C6|nr:hypothetical protein [Aerococcaceae bacterium zg-1578]